MTPTNKVPFLFLGSPPIGPIALKVLEQNHYLPKLVVTDTALSTDELIDIVQHNGIGFILVVGFGAILKQDLLDSVAGQVLNIHPSMLPEYRGPAPVVQTILDGMHTTGVTLMEVDAKMDHGVILAQEEHTLAGNEIPDELYQVLTQKGTHLFLDNIDAYIAETLIGLPQMHDEATFTHFIKKEDGLLNLSEDAHENERKVRAFQGWPGTYVMHKDKRLIIHKVHVAEDALVLDEVQPENGKKMSFAAYCNGMRVKPEQALSELSML
jgi:methionyl-tRNA formyltransferase